VGFRHWASGAACATVVAIGAAAPLAQPDRRTVWDGVYSAPQALRGQELYRQHCGHCHRDNLTGGGSEAGAPPLVGPIFTFRWRDQPVADLFATIGTTMPQNKPDSLTPDTVIDIVSFLLKANEVPPGAAELPADLEKLREVVFTER
jgi:mono/diheme cytochrome c family protein